MNMCTYIPPILALGGLLLLFGVSLVVASVQTRVALRQLLEYELVAGSIGLFGISVYVMLLTLGSTGPLARFFSLLGGIGAVLNATLLLLVKRHQQ